jgi:hypothetical protein
LPICRVYTEAFACSARSLRLSRRAQWDRTDHAGSRSRVARSPKVASHWFLSRFLRVGLGRSCCQVVHLREAPGINLTSPKCTRISRRTGAQRLSILRRLASPVWTTRPNPKHDRTA